MPTPSRGHATYATRSFPGAPRAAAARRAPGAALRNPGIPIGISRFPRFGPHSLPKKRMGPGGGRRQFRALNARALPFGGVDLDRTLRLREMLRATQRAPLRPDTMGLG